MKTKEQIRLSTLSHGSGWACKIGPDDLAQVLGDLVQKNDDRVIVGYENSDDAAVVRLVDDKYIIQSVDFFTPIIDDLIFPKKLYLRYYKVEQIKQMRPAFL